MPRTLPLVALFVLALSTSAAGTPSPAPLATVSPVRPEKPLTSKQRKAIERLRALGYISGQVPLRARSGVTIHDRARAAKGLNLYVSGHGPELILMNMDGEILHSWRKSHDEIWPNLKISPDHEKTIGYYRRAYLYPNGDVLVIVNGVGIAKLDRNSNVIWANANQAHHDLEVADNGDIYVLTRKAHLVPRFGDTPILEDFVTVLDSDGREKRSVSLLAAFERGTTSRSILDEIYPSGGPAKFDGDIFHTNTLEVLGAPRANAAPEFTQGRILTSMRNLNAIAVVDLDLGQVVWVRRGTYRAQHDPTILENGRLLLLDNGLEPPSRVLEFEPKNMELQWSYEGTPEAPFFTRFSGTAQRLGNGNTLITESMPGRAFEITRAGEIVWQFLNPGRAVANEGLVAQIPEMKRLPPDFPVSWAEGRRDGNEAE